MFRLIARFLPVLLPIAIKFINDRRRGTGTGGSAPKQPRTPRR